MRGVAGRPWAGALAAAAALACIAGCATVPSGGRVDSGGSAERSEPIDDPYVRIVPVPPGRGWLPSDIVKGFLIASANFDDNHKVAREYLTRGTQWTPDPRPSVVVLKKELTPITARSDDKEATVSVEGEKLGEIGPDGQYTAEPKASFKATFGLAKDAQGQWRVKYIPPYLRAGLLLSESDVDRAFRPMNLYFFSPDEPVLVPNGIFLPLINRQDLSRQLVQALLNGPTGWLGPAVVNHFPPGTRLRSEVSITDDVATINLTAPARTGNINRMSAQLAWTLQRLPEVKHIKLQIEGETKSPTAPARAGAIQSAEDWTDVNTDRLGDEPETPSYLRGADNRVSRLLGKRPEPLGVLGDEHLYRPAVSLETQRVAGLNAAGDTLLSGELAASVRVGALLKARPGNRFTAPTWSRKENLWTVESGGGTSTLWLTPKGGKPQQIKDWGLAGHEVWALRVARDGVRAAAIVRVGDRKQLQIGRIVRNRDGTVSLQFFLPISSELEDVTDLAWADSNNLAVLGKTHGGQLSPYWVPVGGGGILPIGFGAFGDPATIAAAPSSPVFIGAKVSGQNRICAQNNLRDRLSEWECQIPGADPAYRG